MRKIDICVGWANTVDEEFVVAIKREAKKKRLSLCEVTLSNLRAFYDEVQTGGVRVRIFMNRADYDNPGFVLLARILKQKGAKVINDPESVLKFGSKSDLLPLLRRIKVPLPEVVVIKGKKHQTFPRAAEIKKIINRVGAPFILKPSVGGFTGDVHVGAKTEKDIRDFWERFAAEDILVHEYVHPKRVLGRLAWVRALYVCDTVIPLWWHPRTHVYKTFGRSKKEKEIARACGEIVQQIGAKVGMELFSTEIAIDKNGEYKVIDYVNHPVDLNTTNRRKDGVPPKVLREISKTLVQP